MSTLLTISDIASGLLCEGYNTVIMGQNFNAMRIGEQTLYRMVGRKIEEFTKYTVLTNEFINNNDVYCGVAGALDHGIRKGENIKVSFVAGSRALLSSAATDILFQKLGIEDRVLL